MGTQQILLIVLSVIIVGVAIAVGISMFNSQSYNSNKTAIASDAQSFATQAVQYYKTPESQGGAGGKAANMTQGKVSCRDHWCWNRQERWKESASGYHCCPS
jgi:flagellar basal body-associated protein FliL